VSSGTDSTVTESAATTPSSVEERVAVPAPEEQSDRSGAERAPDRITVIKPASGRPTLDLRELWAYRELAGIFAWRDFRVRYKQTFIGALWAIIQPFMQMVVMTIVFGKFAEFPSGGLAYPIFSYAGLLLWGYFAGALQRSSNSIVGSVNFITKVYFPRVLLPMAAVVSPIVDFLFASVVLFGLMVYFHVYPGPEILLVPVFVVLAALLALGVGMLLATINVRYRDVPFVVPFLVQIWWFASPVAYSTDSLSHTQQLVLSLNPMFSIINGFRWTVVDTPPPTLVQLAISLGAVLACLVCGLAVFKRNDSRFADQI
jgi:lipopolysaccharide transport system permease protein